MNQQCNLDWDASCDGDAISYCLAGQRERIDCVELGYSGCTEMARSDGTDAYCTR